MFSRNRVVESAIILSIYALGSASSAQTMPATTPGVCAEYAAVPLPAEAEQSPVPTGPPSCASYRSYRGIGRSRNYAAARACAWRERLAQRAGLGQNPQEPIAWVVGGSLILADIYVNGAGVERNIPLAMRLACESDTGMAELAAPAIATRNGTPRPKQFDFCEYAISTLTMSFCQAYASETQEASNQRFFDSLKSTMPPEHRMAFEKLLSAHRAYVEAHALEVDQRGTIRSVRTTRSRDILNDLFRSDLVHLEHGKWPAVPVRQIASADLLLSREYENTIQQLRIRSEQDLREGAVTADHVSRVQEAWSVYRDSWIAFARLRYARMADAIRAKVVLDRRRLLETIR